MADWIVLVLALAAVLLSGLSFAALSETFKQLSEVRSALDIDDKPMQLDIDKLDLRGLVPSDVVDSPSARLVFLHGRCGTCRLVAGAFPAGPPDGTWFVLPPEDIHTTPVFERLVPSGRVIPDHDDQLAHSLRLDVAPAVVTVADGIVAQAFGISTVRQVTRLVSEGAPRVAVATT